jgi:hypothetical protein
MIFGLSERGQNVTAIMGATGYLINGSNGVAIAIIIMCVLMLILEVYDACV